MNESKLKHILQLVDRIPPLSHVASKILNMINDPTTNSSDLEEVICYDQFLTANTLKISNSAFYGFPRRVETISEAIILLGFNTIKSLALALATKGLFHSQVSTLGKDVWRHSLSSAFLARRIANEVLPEKQEVLFIYGLLHDIGKPILINSYPQEYKQVIQLVNEQHLSFPDAEEQVLGVNHMEVGIYLAQKWHFPQECIDAIAHHHNPEISTQNTIEAILALANYMTTENQLNLTRHPDTPVDYGQLVDFLAIDEDTIYELKDFLETIPLEDIE